MKFRRQDTSQSHIWLRMSKYKYLIITRGFRTEHNSNAQRYIVLLHNVPLITKSTIKNGLHYFFSYLACNELEIAELTSSYCRIFPWFV